MVLASVQISMTLLRMVSLRLFLLHMLNGKIRASINMIGKPLFPRSMSYAVGSTSAAEMWRNLKSTFAYSTLISRIF